MTFPGYVCTAPPVSDGVKVRAITLCQRQHQARAWPNEERISLLQLFSLPEFKMSIVGIYRQQHGGSQKPQEEDMEAS